MLIFFFYRLILETATITISFLWYTFAIQMLSQKKWKNIEELPWIMDFHFSLMILHCFLLTREAEGACKWFCGKYSAYRITSPRCSQNEILRSGAFRADNLEIGGRDCPNGPVRLRGSLPRLRPKSLAGEHEAENKKTWTSVRTASSMN